MTTYLVAHHLTGKAMMGLKYYKMAKYYLGIALEVQTKVLNFPKRDLGNTI
jgi:hypothetical protein